MPDYNKQREQILRNTIGTKLTELSLSGRLYFSKRQWREDRDKGVDRKFGRLFDGEIVEYTELVSYETLRDSPEDLELLYEDAELKGEGAFSYFADEKGREYK